MMITNIIVTIFIVLLIIGIVMDRIYTKYYKKYTEALKEQNEILWNLRETEKPLFKMVFDILTISKKEDTI